MLPKRSFISLRFFLHRKMIKSCTVIFGCLLVGEGLVYLTGIPFPSSIAGMLLLTALLALRVVKLSWVKPMTDLMVRNLAFFFVPAGVGLMLYLDVFRREALPIGMSVVVGTFVVLAVVGLTYQNTKKKDR